MTNTNHISALLNNEELALNAWFLKYQQSKYVQQGVEFTSKKRTVEELRRAFQQWLRNNVIELRSIVCPKYLELKNKYDTELELTTGLADALKSYFDFSPEVSVLLIKYGIDKLCHEYA